MRAEDVMTRNVVTIGAGASVREAARLLVEHRVSGLPVVDAESRVVGLVTEADLIARQKGPPGVAYGGIVSFPIPSSWRRSIGRLKARRSAT